MCALGFAGSHPVAPVRQMAAQALRVHDLDRAIEPRDIAGAFHIREPAVHGIAARADHLSPRGLADGNAPGEFGELNEPRRQPLARGGIETPESVHPVVIRHPGSGKKVLYVNPGFTLRFEGKTREESLPLLMKLFAHAMDPARVYRFEWRPGSVAMWDTRATWHFALNDYHGHYRLMHRITLGGEPLQAT